MEVIPFSFGNAVQANEPQLLAQKSEKRKSKIYDGPVRRSERIKLLTQKRAILSELERINSKEEKGSRKKRRTKKSLISRYCRLCDGCRQYPGITIQTKRREMSKKIWKKPWSRVILPDTTERTLISSTDVRIPEKICGITKKGDTKYVIVQWKNINAPEYVKESDMSDELSELLQNFLREELQVATETNDSQVEKKINSITNYYRQQLDILINNDVEDTICHIKTE